MLPINRTVYNMCLFSGIIDAFFEAKLVCVGSVTENIYSELEMRPHI